MSDPFPFPCWDVMNVEAPRIFYFTVHRTQNKSDQELFLLRYSVHLFGTVVKTASETKIA